MIKYFLYCVFLIPFCGWGQLTIEVNLKAGGRLIGLNEDIQIGDHSFHLEQARFYLSKFAFYQNGQLTALDSVEAYLIDFEIDSTRKISFPHVQPSRIDEIRFLFGIDSLTNTSGAMDGALDPMHGMYWSWQSGYINCKLEGVFLTPKREIFQLHLGGYAHPFSGVQSLVLKKEGANRAQLNLDLDALMTEVVRPGSDTHVMSPGAKAVIYAQLLAKSIDLEP